MVKFQIGDLVYLKSGSPKMTIERVDHDPDRILCSWFTDKKEKETAWFHQLALQRIDDV